MACTEVDARFERYHALMKVVQRVAAAPRIGEPLEGQAPTFEDRAHREPALRRTRAR